MKLKLTFIIIILSFALLESNSQDIHFSHLHSTPLLINPAFAGVFEGDLRVASDYKSQWRSVTTNYQTIYASVDMNTRTVFGTNSAFGFGLELFSDKAGDLNFRNNGVYLSVSGIQSLDRKGHKLLSGGLKFGLMNRSVDFTKIHVFDNEPQIDNGIDNNLWAMDVALGVAWFHELKSKHSYLISASYNHINRPEVGMGLYNENPEAEILYRKLNVNIRGNFIIGKKMNLIPSISLMDQGPHREILMGTFWKYKTYENHRKKKQNMSLFLGVWGRWYFEFDGINGFDAIVASVRLNMNTTAFTFSYDINTSSLSLVSYGRGGPELSITHIAEWRGARKKVHCPTLNF